ncbi:40S ribosomal protein S23 [Linum perenne]
MVISRIVMNSGSGMVKPFYLLFTNNLFLVDFVWKTRGMGAARKLKDHRRRQRWADKAYKKSNLGNEWKKPFAGSSHAKGIVLEKIGIEAKQPNSAIRKCARVQLIKNGKKIAAFVPNDGCLNYIEENVSQIYPSCLHHLPLFETSLLIAFNLILWSG